MLYSRSPLWDFFENVVSTDPHYNSVILGDSAFPLRRWLLTPYLNPQNDQQQHFNNALSRGRVKVENTFGLWKRRFAINQTGYRLILDNIPTTILATAILHNIAINLNLPVPEGGFEGPAEVPGDEGGEIEEAGEEERQNLSERQLRQVGQRFRDDLAARF